MHKPSALNFAASEEAKQYVPYLDFEEVAAVKATSSKEMDRAKAPKARDSVGVASPRGAFLLEGGA